MLHQLIHRPNLLSRACVVGCVVGCVFASIGSGHCQTKREPSWEIIRYQGRDYVTTKSIQNYYRFDSYEVSRGGIYYKSRDLLMKARSGSQDLYIKNTRFHLSYPVAVSDGNYLISWMDLTKLIDPVLRPDYIKPTRPFSTVILDPGHGGVDSGTSGIYGNEKAHALRLAKLVRAELERRGLRVKMTRTTDIAVARPQRVAYANRISDAIFVSLHFNGSDRTARGVETYALSPQGAESTMDGPQETDHIGLRGNDEDSANIALATAVHAAVMHKVGAIDRGIRRARWEVLRGINKPGILFEGGFLTNRSDAKQIASSAYLTKMASAIADGIINYRNALRR